MGKRKIIMAVIFSVLFFGGCTGRQRQTTYVTETAEYFGTVITITLYGEDEESLKTRLAYYSLGRVVQTPFCIRQGRQKPHEQSSELTPLLKGVSLFEGCPFGK